MKPVTHARTSAAQDRRRGPGERKQPRALLSPPIGRRSFVRVDSLFLESVVIGQLTASELRSFLALLSYVARWRGECNPVNGTFPRKWVTFATYAKLGGLGRVTPKQLEKFLALGLLVELEDDDGRQFLGVVDWRDVHPLEWTGAIRQARWREQHDMFGRRKRRLGDPGVEP